MRILTRYLIKEMLGAFAFGVLSFAAILIGFALVRLAQQPMLNGSTILKLLFFLSPQQIALAFPMGVLIGTLFALSRLSGHSEVTAMRAGGLSGPRMLIPFVIFGLLAGIFNLFLSEYIVPRAHRSYDRILYGSQQDTVLYRQVLPAEYEADGSLKRLIHVDEFDLQDLYLHGVFIQEFTDGRPKTTIMADEMVWNGKVWLFKQGWIAYFSPDGTISRLTVSEGTAEYQPILPPPKEIAPQTDPVNMSWPEYKAFIARRAKAGEEVRQFLVELYTRLALPFACFALAVAGAPLGIQSNRGGTAMSFGLALLLLIVYFFLLSMGQVLGRTGVLPVSIAPWLPNVILCGAGVWLLRRRIY